MKIKYNIFIGKFMIGFIALSANGRECPPEIVRYYEQWVGCKAPPIKFDQSDRTRYAESSYKGKRILLYSFDAGNFCDAPNLPALTKELSELQKVRATSTESLYVIGYTRGLLWSPCLGELGTHQMPQKIDELSRFPVVNLNNKRDENAMGEPYELLKLGPSAILIGTNGVICKIFPHRMTERDFSAAMTAARWNSTIREPPKETSKQVFDKTPKKNLLVARQYLVVGTVLTYQNVVVDTITQSELPKSFFQSDEFGNLIGKVLIKPAREGQPLSPDMITHIRPMSSAKKP